MQQYAVARFWRMRSYAVCYAAVLGFMHGFKFYAPGMHQYAPFLYAAVCIIRARMMRIPGKNDPSPPCTYTTLLLIADSQGSDQEGQVHSAPLDC